MSYHLIQYFAIFLPIAIIAYQIAPKKFRWAVLLVEDYLFFYLISGKLILYLWCATLFAHHIGLWLETAGNAAGQSAKEKKGKKRKILAFGILISLAVLAVLKYLNFFGTNVSAFLQMLHVDWQYTERKFLIPIGISYYTLQVISYLTDVYRGTVPCEKNLAKLALYLSFFPQIMEGPISRFHEVAEDLYSGNSICLKNLMFGYERIIWGLFKKLIVADRLAPVVTKVFGNYANYDGAIVLFGILCYTCQLYMEFSGCMDIIIGSGEIFGVKLPENFRQPFFAKDAGDFWRRWHITLGTWFKDYIFYPVSLAKPVKNLAKKVKARFGRNVGKFVAPTAALFCVWTCNGLWHGAKWTYIFYGMYYFVLIFLENITEAPVAALTKKLHINREAWYYRIFRFAKLFVIVNLGEMFFRAESVKDGFLMLKAVFSSFHPDLIFNQIYRIGIDMYDFRIAVAGVIVVFIVGILHEKDISIREVMAKQKLPVRWVFWYAAIFAIVIFGAYGVGYDTVAMIYAGY